MIGYIGTISKSEYKNLKSEGYKYYQKIGKFGIEKQYDKELRGTDGFIRRIVDVRNRTENEEVGQRPIAGDNLVLTIDAEVQNAASEAMGDLRGAVVAIKASTGEVLALLSKPDYDPNLVISKNNQKIIAAINADKNKPFLNRAIQSAYPPASTFKLINAIAALETDRAKPNLRFYCSGKFTLKGYADKDFYCYGKHYSVDMHRAIPDSCNVYFYQLGYKIGPSAMLRYADYFGYNNKTEIDLPGEVTGFVPSKKWKMKTYNQPWFDGDTINLSIGQGFTTVTPIETCNLVCALVNNGVINKPYLLKELRSADNSTIKSVKKPEVLREIPLSAETLATVKLGMRNSAVNGTSARLNWLKVQAAGKTGTVQTRSERKDLGSQHAWFIGYAPYDGDQEKAIAVTVFVEYVIAGATSAVPVAEKIFSKLEQLGYFR
jgi:penicillin-binding protein 2